MKKRYPPDPVIILIAFTLGVATGATLTLESCAMQHGEQAAPIIAPDSPDPFAEPDFGDWNPHGDDDPFGVIVEPAP